MSALFDITQNTLGPGLGPGEARIDGVPGELVTITIQDLTVQEVEVTLEWTPPDDEVAFFNLAANPADIKEATFTPTSNAINASGSYLIRVVTDASNPARRDEAELVFVIVTPNSGLVIPALNEPGNPLASLVTPVAPGAANNVPFLGPGRNVPGSPIADINFAAWWKAFSDLTLVVDGFSGGAGEVNTGVDVGVGTALVDGPNVGVQIPIRTVDGINGVGVALNGQTVEVDGALLLDLTAVRHIVGPDFLTLEYASNPTIQIHNDSFAAEIDKRWSVQSIDGSSSLFIGAAAADGSVLGLDNSGLTLERNAGTANVDIATLLGETVRLRSGQFTGGGTVLIQPDGTVSDEYPLLTMTSNGTFNASVEWHVGDRTPVGNITGNPGDFYVRADDGVTSSFYQHNGAAADNTSWIEIGAAASGLQGAYNIGPLVNVTSAQGPLTINVAAAQAVGPLVVQRDGTPIITVDALGGLSLDTAGTEDMDISAGGRIDITSLDAADDMNIVSALAGIVVSAPLGLATFLGQSTAVTASTGAVNITNDATDGVDEGVVISAAGDITVQSASGETLDALTQGAGAATFGAAGTGLATLTSVSGAVAITAPASNIDVTADDDLVMSADNGILNVSQGGGVILGATVAGVMTLQPSDGLGSLVINALGDVALTGGVNEDVAVEATGTGGLSLIAATGSIDITGNGDFSLSIGSGSNVTIDAVTGALQLDGSTVGFFGTTPASKPTVTGSRGGNAALASLLTGLETLGLIIDSST